MRVCVLASGSTGNATIIESGNQAILIDNGLSYKKLEEAIKKAHFDEKKLTHILITHDHGDHIKGAGICARKLNLTVCAPQKTLDVMIKKGILKGDKEQVYSLEKGVEDAVGCFDVTPFHISHDAVDPVGYIVRDKEQVLVYLTDVGFVTEEMINRLKNANTYIMETNHNVEMLQNSPRPWSLKQRILSDEGHLSNDDAAFVLSRLIGDRTKHVFLAHLSLEANMPDLVMMTVKHILKQQNVDMSAFSLHMTYPHQPSKVIEL